MSFKKCFVPSCSNTSLSTPDKIFLTVPKNVYVRRRWFDAIKVKNISKSVLYCCEDHFILQDDAENWMHFKIMGSSLKIKETVVPHKCLADESVVGTHSQLSPLSKKRKIQNILKIDFDSGKQKSFSVIPSPILKCISPQKYETSVETSTLSSSGEFSIDILPSVTKSVQVNIKTTQRSTGINTNIPKTTERACSPISVTVPVIKQLSGHSPSSTSTESATDSEYKPV